MSEPERRVRNGKVRWYVRYFDPSGKRVSKTFDRKVDAQRFLHQVETSKITGGYIDPARSRITIGAFADKWLGRRDTSSRARSPDTAASCRSTSSRGGRLCRSGR